MIKVLFVCLGNICRSPMAEFVLKDMVRKIGLEKEFIINSVATDGGYNARNNEGIYPDTKAILKKHNIPFTDRISVEMTKEDYNTYDYILAMDTQNISSILKYIESDPKQKVCRLLDYTDTPSDIADPWYYGNFDKTYEDITKGCKALLKHILKTNKLN